MNQKSLRLGTRIFPVGVALLGCLTIAASASFGVESSPRPNIVFILADDLGYGDLGCYGQKITRTPNLDHLASEGMRFTQHYAGDPVCAPSRCVLMTGKHPGHAFIRNNSEVGAWESLQGQLPIPPAELTIATVLQKAGYATGAFGKWGLGGVGSSGDPLKHGFEHFFGYNDQRHAHNYYPRILISDEVQIKLNNPPIKIPAVLPPEAEVNDSKTYERFSGKDYAPDLVAAEALKFVHENKEKPFFLYYPTTVPHLALQVPEDSLAEYRGKLPDAPYRGDSGFLPQQFPHAAYAAMITRMDREIGRLIRLVKDLGLDDRTIFIFTSDNGGWHHQAGLDPEFFKSNGDLRGYKGEVYEGGMREPLIVRWKGHVRANTTSAAVTGFEDWFPTLLELTGLSNNLPQHLDGISFAPTLLGRKQPERPFLYREFHGYGGQQSVRVGDWKLLHRDMLPSVPKQKHGPATTELYDLAKDPGETNNAANSNPEVMARLAQIMKQQHVASKEFPFPLLDGHP